MYAAALANGGSFDDIQPGIDFFAKLKKNGNYIPVESTPATVEKGETPDQHRLGLPERRLRRRSSRPRASTGRSSVPTDGKYAQYYSQAINKDAPHPAAARLWEEYLYSAEGQNLWLKGYARPVLLPAMTDGRHRSTRPPPPSCPQVAGTPSFPTEAQHDKAKDVLVQNWAKAVSG